jgi:hypothetical protein
VRKVKPVKDDKKNLTISHCRRGSTNAEDSRSFCVCRSSKQKFYVRLIHFQPKCSKIGFTDKIAITTWWLTLGCCLLSQCDKLMIHTNQVHNTELTLLLLSTCAQNVLIRVFNLFESRFFQKLRDRHLPSVADPRPF